MRKGGGEEDKGKWEMLTGNGDVTPPLCVSSKSQNVRFYKKAWKSQKNAGRFRGVEK